MCDERVLGGGSQDLSSTQGRSEIWSGIFECSSLNESDIGGQVSNLIGELTMQKGKGPFWSTEKQDQACSLFQSLPNGLICSSDMVDLRNALGLKPVGVQTLLERSSFLEDDEFLDVSDLPNGRLVPRSIGTDALSFYGPFEDLRTICDQVVFRLPTKCQASSVGKRSSMQVAYPPDNSDETELLPLKRVAKSALLFAYFTFANIVFSLW